MSITANERAEMCDLFEQVGPDAPTLCEGWTTRDLLAHMLVRERRLDAAAGVVVPFLRQHAADVTSSIAAEPWETMIKTFREGPPLWSPWAIPVVGDKANVAEFFVHHEDVRRAQPEWEPRPEDPARDDALWNPLKMLGRLLFRKSPVGVTLRSAGRDDIVVKKPDADKGGRAVVLVGQPGEIVLHGFGRPLDKARLVVQGEPDDIEAFEASARGL
jgi:uncharacterized protein (TIGR03085 family)